MEYDFAYLQVKTVLKDLDLMFFWFDDEFDSGIGISFFSISESRGFRNMYRQLRQMESFLTDWSDKDFFSFSSEIVEIVCKAREYIVSWINEISILKIDEKAMLDAEAKYREDRYTRYHDELQTLPIIPKKEEHFVLYDAVVSLLHDLELILSSHHSEQQFWKADIQIMYDNLSIMDSLLVDKSDFVNSSAKGYESYDKNLMNGLEHWVGLVANVGQEYIDLWPKSSIRKHSTGSFPDDYMHELAENMKDINRKFIRSFPPSEHIFELHETTSTEGAAQVSCKNLHRITKSIEFVNNRLKRIRDGRDIIQTSTQSLQGTTFTGQAFIKLNKLPNEEDKPVGFDHDFLEILSLLIGNKKKLKVFTVVGMGGSGKTTFTESLYNCCHVKSGFDIRAWFTISQQYRVKEVLIGLLRCTDPTTEIYGKDTENLEEKLYQSLKGKKYLIVLDDIWDKKAWNDLKRIFPNEENGSRIMLTTRLIDVAEFASSDTQPHRLPRLSPEKSWELLRSKIPINESCPLELEPIGKEIARKCQGLPLAIVVVAGLLSKMNMTVEVWKDVAKSVSSIVMEEQGQCQNILALSYNHLPDNLKRCFLYMGNFPEDSKIPAKKLIWLWIGEGFIRPREEESLEEVAENYLEDLIGRSLVQVNRRRYDGKFKTCFLHDMLRDLCLGESHKQHFFLIFHKNLESMTEDKTKNFMSKCRRVCLHSNTLDITTISWVSNTRSFLWFKTITSMDFKSYSFMNLKRLKVLDVIDGHLEELPTGIASILANLRYLALSFQKSIDRSIFGSTFHSIQILIVEGEWNGQLRNEFWSMSELRHFYLKRSFLSYGPEESRPNIIQLASESESPQTLIYPVQYEEQSIKDLQNLRSLTTIRPISCTEAVFLSMPRLKKLGVFENEEDYGFRGWLKNLVHLKELQTLNYVFRDPFVRYKPDRLPSQNFVMVELINLTISGTSFPWEDMLKLCAMFPKLEVLKLKNYAFSGSTWTLESDAGGFPCLKYLLIGTTNLQSWEADGTDYFPKLQHLVLMKCRQLKEIPRDILKEPLLERIELDNCSETTVASAEEYEKEQREEYGNESFVLHVTPDRRQRDKDNDGDD